MEDWQSWLQGVVKDGLTAKWDAEYLQRFGVARQTPLQPVGTGNGVVAQAPMPAPRVSPLILLGGVAALGAALYFVMRD